ncbi:hypothetical protein [Arthrobacter sp. E3]|uniref:hypothetical protein n=1 Tax=Arthrobacter sp. E3 TaxID=517402 RepID=UPI001A947B0E|nr:hypothetical protein [Arthrobacter sp. E3]
MTSLPAVRGAHLVGSINQPTAADSLRIVAENLAGHVARYPDGEVGERFHWILFQGSKFDAVAGLERVPRDPIMLAGFDVRPLVLDGTVPAGELVFGPLGYAEAALAGYRDFKALREAGTIPTGARFQVCLPTPLAPLSVYVAPADRPAVYPLYAAAICKEIAAIAAAIPAEELAIQIDLATEFSYIEQVAMGARKPFPWFIEGLAEDADVPAETIIEAVTTMAAEVAATVPEHVELGFHLCYGDVAEKHFVEPADAGNLTAVANALSARVARPIGFLQLPVPIERDDEAYFAPMATLALHPETALYLGLVHHEDGTEGGLRRIAAARPALAAAGVEEFGVATECGLGRGPEDRMAPLLRLHAEIIKAASV